MRNRIIIIFSAVSDNTNGLNVFIYGNRNHGRGYLFRHFVFVTDFVSGQFVISKNNPFLLKRGRYFRFQFGFDFADSFAALIFDECQLTSLQLFAISHMFLKFLIY